MFTVALGPLLIWKIYQTNFLAGFWGIRNDEIAVITIEKDQEDSLRTITAVAPNKSLWDVAELLGVPVALALFGALFQKAQQEQSERQTKEQREQDADEMREEALQLYFDRMSALLIDKNLMAIAIRKDNIGAEQKELLEVSVDVIKARTLSILKRFEKDTERKSSVVRFLTEANVTSRLGIGLSGTDLSGADLSKANLRKADLSETNLTNANLINADLSKANLSKADLSEIKLNGANLSGADLSGAYIRRSEMSKTYPYLELLKANLDGANLDGADLSHACLSLASGLTTEQVSKAILCNTQLPKDIELDPNFE